MMLFHVYQNIIRHPCASLWSAELIGALQENKVDTQPDLCFTRAKFVVNVRGKLGPVVVLILDEINIYYTG